MPNGIHIAIVVFGTTYTTLLVEITLANLAALVLEIPGELRRVSRVRIFTTKSDMLLVHQATTLGLLRSRIDVEITDAALLAGYHKYGAYGPMIETQRRFVIDAARENAAIFFVGPDLIFSRGSFRTFVERLQQGYRQVVGPGPRVKREAVRRELRQIIAASPDGAFALSPQEQASLFFRNWHPINNQFLIEHPESIWWKAYVSYRPHPEELFFRFLQGPTFAAWPLYVDDEFDSYIDHHLPDLCCETWRQIYVVPDSDECLALDLTDEARFDLIELADIPRAFLLHSLFNKVHIRDMKLRYGMRTCRVHRGERDSRLIRKWERDFARAIDPLLLVAVTDRVITRRLGDRIGRIFRLLSLLNTHTLSFLLGALAPLLLGRWKTVFPLRH